MRRPALFFSLITRNDPQQTFLPELVHHATRHAFHHSRSRHELRTVEVIRPWIQAYEPLTIPTRPRFDARSGHLAAISAQLAPSRRFRSLGWSRHVHCPWSSADRRIHWIGGCDQLQAFV